MADDKSRVRLAADVKKLAEDNGKKNGRTLPLEVNFTLRDAYTNKPVNMRFDLLPPTYWQQKDWESYAKTCVYPGTEESSEPVVHTREHVNGELGRMGMANLIPSVKRKAKR